LERFFVDTLRTREFELIPIRLAAGKGDERKGGVNKKKRRSAVSQIAGRDHGTENSGGVDVTRR